MNTKTFKKQDIQNAVCEDTDETSPLVLEHAGPWVDEGKYQYQENILKETATGVFYTFSLSKSGSYFTDFTYNFEWLKDEVELTEVIKSTKSIVIWIPVED